MFQTLRDYYDRWLAVDNVKTDKQIRYSLQWCLKRNNYRALFRTFLENDLSSETGISEEEYDALLRSVSSADRGEKVTTEALPRISNKDARLRIGAWLTNTGRSDLTGMPLDADGIVPVSCYCDDKTGRVVASTFRALGYEGRMELGQLRQVLQKANLRTWSEVSPYVVGPCFASCGSSLSYADCLLFPPTGVYFSYSESLGAVHLSSLNSIVVRLAAARAIKGYLQRFGVEQPLPAVKVARELKKTGWKVTNLR